MLFVGRFYIAVGRFNSNLIGIIGAGVACLKGVHCKYGYDAREG